MINSLKRAATIPILTPFDTNFPSNVFIRGATSHYDYVCNEVSKGIAAVSLESGVPVMFGILTTENIEQAIERAGILPPAF
mgnify:CR=1 FL=1